MERVRLLQAWQAAGYQPSKRLLDTVTAIESGPLGPKVKEAIGHFRTLPSTNLRAVDEATTETVPSKNYPRRDWWVIVAAALVCEDSRLAGRDDSVFVRIRLEAFLDRVAGRPMDEGGTLPSAEAKPREGRRGSVEPPPPPPPPAPVESEPVPEVDDDEPPSGLTLH